MTRSPRSAWLLGLLLLACNDAQIPERADRLEVRVLPRVELAAILYRLAGYPEHGMPGFPTYDRAVEEHFRAFEDHESVAFVRQLREESHISYSASVEPALMADEQWRLRAPLEPHPEWLDDRWDRQSVEAFLAAAARFERDTDAESFFRNQGPFYRKVERALEAELSERVDLGWIRRFFGNSGETRFNVVPGLLHGPHNYASHLELPDGSLELFCLLATPEVGEGAELRYPIETAVLLLVHEFSHPFANPWVDRHLTELRPSAERVFQVVERDLTRAAYGSPEILLYESVVRAVTQAYALEHGDEAGATRELRDDRQIGFWWTGELAELLFDEEDGEDRLTSNLDEVVRFFETWAGEPQQRVAAARAAFDIEERERRESGPRIVRLVPADGETTHPPGPTTLEIHFDRRMERGITINGVIPEILGQPEWDDSATVFSLPVNLEAGTTYDLELNGDDVAAPNFKSEAGEPLAATTWTFGAAGLEGADLEARSNETLAPESP